ncbi:phytanoyl-CoA dioxygenase family protein [Tistrella mobilis]|uniref:phytanoyl-CoA dioxygenase family protein n=1 Tax=Tistrella mobilis TaxID=171437 RepID=UPI0031F61B21
MILDKVVDTFDYYELENGGAAQENLRASIQTNGFAVLKGVFSEDEIGRMRQQSGEFLLKRGIRLGLGRTRSNVAADMEELAWVFGHERILNVVLWSLVDASVVYTGHSDAHMNMVAGWHKDSETRYGSYFSQPCIGVDSCKVYKIGIYLQDHSHNNTGLKVRRGSHKSSNLTDGDITTIHSGAGDIVIFDVRISHCGDLPDPIESLMQKMSRVLKGRDPHRQDPEIFVRAREKYVEIRRNQQKMSLFFTFGIENQFTIDFSNNNMKRQLRQIELSGGVSKTNFPAELSERLRQMNIKLLTFGDTKTVRARPEGY